METQEVHATAAFNEPRKHKNIVFVFVTFSSENPGIRARFSTRPWSPVVQKWTQEIAFSESEPYIITETSLAWCCSAALWMCSVFCWENVIRGERERNQDMKRGECWMRRTRGRRSLMLMAELSEGWRNCQIRMQQFPFTPRVSSQWDVHPDEICFQVAY